MHSDNNSTSFLGNIKNDLPSSVVVFFVALPLCLGIALASGAPLFSGLIAGIVGGIVVGALSGSAIGVSGPAAGLAAIVLTAIGTLGGFENFLLAVVLGGIIQLVFGLLKAGIIGYYFPSSVIKGMLTGIGIIIILKQIPHFFGYDGVPEGDFSFLQEDGRNLVAVVLGIIYFYITQGKAYGIESNHLVNVPIPSDFNSFLGQFSFPNFAEIGNPAIWITAFTIALVASLETLLCVEATDKLDPEKRVTPTNRELMAQGTGNIISGMIGGLPITQVIVRSSANIQSGGRTKASAIIHGMLLLISVVLIPGLLNMIPLSVLAAILLIVGFKLAKPGLFKVMYALGWKQFLPFMITVLGIVFTDLLVGIGMGLAVGVVIILIKSYQNSHFLHVENNSNGLHKIKMTLAEEVTFFNKGAILKELDSLPQNSYLELDVRQTRYLDNDIIEILEDFTFKAKNRNINIKLVSERGIVENPSSIIEFFKLNPKPEKQSKGKLVFSK